MARTNKSGTQAGWWWRGGVTLALLVGGLALAPREWARELEWKTENLLLRLREQLGNPPPHEALRLVAVDEESVQATGQWPWPRPVHGLLLQSLGGGAEAAWPAVVTWDILFVDANLEPSVDEMFAQQLAELRYPVVFGAVADPGLAGLKAHGAVRPLLTPLGDVRRDPALARLPDQRGALLPMMEFLAATRPAFLDAQADSDGIVRRLPLVVRVGDEVFPSLVLETLLAYWKLGPEAVEIRPGEAVTLRDAAGAVRARIPIDEAGRYVLNYRYEKADEADAPAEGAASAPTGGGKTPRAARMPAVGYNRLFAAATADPRTPEQAALLDSVAGRILLVGQTATGMSDIGPSPLRGQSAKVLVHLNALDNILKGDHLRHAPLWPALAGALLLGLGLAWLLDRRGYGAHALALPLAFAGVAAGGAGALLGATLMVPLAFPLGALAVQQAAVLTLKLREERAQRERVKGMFGAYVSPALVKRMVDSGEEPKLGGVEEEITAYFSDIEGFSSFSEKLTPPQLVELMNEYLTACTDIVQAEGGTLDKYIGDAVVAMYGAPLALPEHGHCAVVAALRVQKRCAELRAKWKNEPEKNWPEIVTRLQTRIGLNSGRAVVGNMGSHTRFNYTMMGDTVNLAARMESGAKSYGVYTMLTAATKAQSERVAPGAVLFRRLDRIVVKGRSQAVEIFEAVALARDLDMDGAGGEAGRRTRECVRLFEEGLARYWAQDWDGAEQRFRESAALEANAGHSPSDVLLERVAHMRTHPPGVEWDGVWRMTSK